MKLFSYIFSFYLFALAFLPCNDFLHDFAANINSLIGIELIAQCATTCTTASKDCEDEPCSPLCDCSCCMQNFNFPSSNFFLLKKVIQKPNTIIAFDTALLGILSINDIWQPPKIR